LWCLFPEKAFLWMETLRNLKFWWMTMSIVRGSKTESLLLAAQPELQELIVWMVMRPGRQQMLSCLYNLNPTNKLLPQKFRGTSWHPGGGDRSSHSHMPPARPVVKKKRAGGKGGALQ
jgi:hypothetical protein